MNPRFSSIAGPRATGQRIIAIATLGAGMFVSLPACAQTPGGHARATAQGQAQTSVAGVVRDAAGSPQIGALVELLGPNLGVVARTFTDDRGRYLLPRLTPGVYQVKASASLFLPTLRENLHLLADSRLVVNLTLNTLYQAFQWLPAQARQADEPRDDWNWTLRLSTNRPLLRVLEDDNGIGPLVLVTDGKDAGDAAARRVTVRSGSNRFGTGGMHQDVEIERNHDDAHQLILRTDLGQTETATLQTTAAYLRQLAPGTAVISVASFSERPDVVSSGDRGLQVLTLRSAATMAFGPDIDVEVGNELQAVHLGSTLSATHPFASLTLRHDATTARYRLATSPDADRASDLDRDSSLSPRVTERAGSLRLEQGLHQALEIEHHSGSPTASANSIAHEPGASPSTNWTNASNWTTGITYFEDTVEHPLIGGGVAVIQGKPALAAADISGGNLLYDPATQLITVSGQTYSGSGLMAFARDQLTPDAWVSLRYALGQALAMDGASDPQADSETVTREQPTLAAGLGRLHAHTTPMLAASVGGRAENAGTEWRASYRWQPSGTLTQVDPFDSSTPEAYLSLHLRQPIRLHHRGNMQAIVDVRNLLAQGYRPFLSQDGSTLYFAQAERCIEGGLSFSF